MFSIATAPAKQSVGETISVLSGRLSSATLLEDRRAAILGLRSFAKQYPASVASGALRSLIGSLGKDGEDVDTVKVVFETLLMLFSPNADSPEASDEVALWLADEFTQRQENITLLLDFLETNDFYSRLYSLQLLIAILSARTERTEECVFTAPLGISRLVAILDDGRDAIRNEAMTLLTYLTPNSADIQKLVAFENAFDRLFNIVTAEGSLPEGGRIVEDVLILLANLLRLNPSNQSLFRETGCNQKLSKLLGTAYKPRGEEEVAPWAQAQRNRNIYALLAVIRLFLVPGAVGTAQNQIAFWQHGLLEHCVQLAFNHDVEIPIKAEALVTCADIIRGNANLQGGFTRLQVPFPLDEPVARNGSKTNGTAKVDVIEGLLGMTLGLHALQAFDIRLAACRCLQAYFYSHQEARMYFLRIAVDGHKAGADPSINILSTLLQPPPEALTSDPYRIWFSAVLMLHLINEDPDAKSLAMSVIEGDEASGEELVTSIQTITAHLISSLSRADDGRVVVAYLMLLICWLFEDLDGVDDFLGEGSNIQSLIQAVLKNTNDEVIEQGLCAMLLGVVYEFSTKDSPIPRVTLQPILMNRMGRDRYIDKLNRLRSHPLMRDFEVIPQKLDPASDKKFPDVYFDSVFVDFFKDNYSRMVRAIDRDPGMEISVVTNGVQKGVSRELVDSLRAQVEEKEAALQDAQVKLATLDQKLGQEQADHRRTKDSAAVELDRAKSSATNDTTRMKADFEARQRQQEQELGSLKSQNQAVQQQLDRVKSSHEAMRLQNERDMGKLREEHKSREGDLQRQVETSRRAVQEAERAQSRAEAQMADLKATNSRLEVDVMKANKTKTQELHAAKEASDAQMAEQAAVVKRVQEEAKALENKCKTAGDRVKELEERLEESEARVIDAETKLEESEARVIDAETKLEKSSEAVKKAESDLKQKAEEKDGTQGELDDLLMVFGDLEEKVNKYKARLKALGEQVSEGEGDDDDEEDDEDGEEDGDDVD